MVVKKKVKKKFFEVELPLINQKVTLQGISISDLDKRTLKIDLTRNLRGRGIEAVFKVNVIEDKTNAEAKRLHLFGFYIRRMMRKSIDYVEDSFSGECKNAVLKIKLFLITRKKVHRSVRKALREKARQEILDYIKDKNYEEIFSEILMNKIQRALSQKLKKIYPLAMCETRDISVIKKKEEVKEEKVK